MAPRRARWILVLVACLAGILGAAICVWHLPGVRRQIAESTSHQPVPFTELYFTDPGTLPKHLLSGGPNVFRFTIANHEDKTVTYAYVVTAESALGTGTVAQSQVTIADGASRDVAVQAIPPQTGITYLITVQLVGRPEAIHFTGTS